MGLSDASQQFPKFTVKEDLWNSLTKKDSLTGSFDYQASYTYSRFIESLNLPTPVALQPNEFIEIEDEELARAMDHHSIVTSLLPNDVDNFQTADEIIEELDRLMVGDDQMDEIDLSLADPQTCVESRSDYFWKPLPVLNQMTIPQLNHLIDEIDSCIRHYSACLVSELATREELDYEQELKDIFLTRLHDIQARIDRRSPYSRYKNNKDGEEDDDDSDDDDAGEEYMAKEEEDKSDGQKYKQEIIYANELETSRTGRFLAGNSASATKAALVNVAHAVQRHWRRMGRSIENATRAPSSNHRNNQSSVLRKGLQRRTSSAVNFIRRRLTQPVQSTELSAAHEHHQHSQHNQLAISNSTVDLYETVEECEWVGGGIHTNGERMSASTTPIQLHSPHRQGNSLTNSTTIANEKLVNPEVEMKFLSTTIPYHESPMGEGPTVGHLELFNEFLLCMLTNNPHLTPLLTDYILNVYAPSEKAMPKLVI